MRRPNVFAGILALVLLVITIIVGCSSSPYATQNARQGGLIGAVSGTRADARPIRSLDLPAPTQEELWIIQRSDKQAPQTGEIVPGSGVLAAQQGEKLVPVPLKHTDVKASITGYIATVDV